MTPKSRQTEHHGRHRWRNLVRVLAAVVVFCTTYALILPALTMESQLICELPEHTHSDACWEEIRVVDETELICGKEEHIHDGECYSEQQTLVCKRRHDHDESCYVTQLVLECQKELHIHGDACREVVGEHTEWVCTCGMQEHTHTTECFDAAAEECGGFYCGEEEHVHGELCYDPNGVLSCTMKEHTHTLLCSSNPLADLEPEEVWGPALEALPLTGEWAHDVPLVAQSQMGYVESAANFRITEEGGIRGYSRYGAWYGRPYEAWDAMFVQFCLHYAGVSYPAGGTASELAASVGSYFRTAEHEPQPGELIFFGTDGAERVGIVWDVTPDSVKIIGGDLEDTVRAEEYSLSDPQIFGYAALPEQNVTHSLSLGGEMTTVIGPMLSAGPLGAPAASGGDQLVLGSSDSDYIDTAAANNAWQIAAEHYGVNETTLYYTNNGTVTTDVNNAALALHKRLVPTDKEDEFQVYLSIDKRTSIRKYFSKSELMLNNNQGSNTLGAVYDGGSVKKGQYTEIYDEAAVGGSNAYHVKFYIYEYVSLIVNKKGNTIISITPDPNNTGALVSSFEGERYGSAPNCNNGALYVKLPEEDNKYLCVQSTISLQAATSGHSEIMEVYIGLNNFAEIDPLETVLNGVEDIIGDRFEFLGMDTVYSDGAVALNGEDTLSWTPVDNPNSETVKITNAGSNAQIWEIGCSHLAYRVRLKTEEDDFVSCAEHMTDNVCTYPANESAVLTYSRVKSDGAQGNIQEYIDKEAAFPIPTARGLNYDLEFTKIARNNGTNTGTLKNVPFSLQLTDGTGNVLETTTDANGRAWFRGLPAGTYTLTETSVPRGYAGMDPITITLSKTLDASHLSVQTEADPEKLLLSPSVESFDMRYNGTFNDSAAGVVINSKTTGSDQYVRLIKVDENGDPLAGAHFRLCTDSALTTPFTDCSDLVSGTDGVFLSDETTLPLDTYYLAETQAPPGYIPSETVTILVTAEGVQYQLPGDASPTDAAETDGVYTVSVQNVPGRLLPSTGGIGLPTIYALGVLIPMSAFVYCRKSRRRSEGGSR